jgi:hypothetical protein
MDIFLQTTKTANLFHFISNLTNWHFSVRPSYKKYWIEKTGELTDLDREWLAKAENLFKKYTYGDKFWGTVFLRRPEEDVWQVAENTFGQTDTKRFKEIADYFTPRFEKIWNEEESLLNEWITLLKESKDKYLKDDLVSDLNTLFSTKPDLSNGVKVVVLMSSPTTVG